MEFHLLLVFFIWGTTHLASYTFPLHQRSKPSKDVTTQNEKREPTLCWVVHIMTHSKCAVEVEDETDDLNANAIGADNHINKVKPVQVGGYDTKGDTDITLPSRCGSSQESEQHAHEIASEIGLAVVRVFHEFHNHYLMCHINQEYFSSGTSPPSSGKLSLSKITRDHADIRRESAETFSDVKSKTEQHLFSHHEILFFSQEFAFRRHSRLSINNLPRDDSSPHVNQPPSQVFQPLPLYQRQRAKVVSSSIVASERVPRNSNHISIIRDINAFYTQHIKLLISNVCTHNLSTHICIHNISKSKHISHNLSTHICIHNLTKSKHISHHLSTHICAHNLSAKERWKVCRDLVKELKQATAVTGVDLDLYQYNDSRQCRLLLRNLLRLLNNSPQSNISLQYMSETQVHLPEFCGFLKILSLYISSQLETNHFWSLDFDSEITIIPKHMCQSLSSSAKRKLCLKMNKLQEIYAICFISPVENLRDKSSSHLMEKLSSIFCVDSEKRHQHRRQKYNSSEGTVNQRNYALEEKALDNSSVLMSNDDTTAAWMQLHDLLLIKSKDSRRRLRRSLLSTGQDNVQFNDPAFPHQWHLSNHVTPFMDVNVTGVWANGITGQGVTVAVVDDGVEWRNPDLKANYNYHGSWDLNDEDPDPSPSTKKAANHHGTRCAGEIAAVANNNVCGVGVAFDSQFSGLRVLDGVMTDSLEAQAFNMKMDVNDIYSCSWGPEDDGMTVDGPHMMAAKAMKHGVDFGRRGYGSVFVVASGNGGNNHDNCNFDGYANSIYTVTIGAVDENGGMPYYAEECASMLGVTFSSGMSNKRDIVTTDWTFHSNGCTESHTGTSAAAPLAAGMIALMLSARPCLTWRDIQYILILTAKKVDVDIAHWQKNGAGLSHSHKHGFGLLSAWRMVNAARVWSSVPWMTSFSYTNDGVDAVIPKGTTNPLVIRHNVLEEDIRGYGLSILESVQVTVWLTHPSRGQLGIKLTSPSGTSSVIAAPRPKDNSSAGFEGWTFTTVRNWGEGPVGNWTLHVMDRDSKGKFGKGKLTKWRITLFGTPMTSQEFQDRRHLVELAMGGQHLSSNQTASCPPPPEYKDEPSYLSEKTLKIISLASAFCLVMALYETMEYMLCYGEEKEQQALDMISARNAQRLEQNAAALADNTTDIGGGTSSDLPLPGNVVRTLGVSNTDDAAASVPLLSGNDFDGDSSVNQFIYDHAEDDDEEDDIFDVSETRKLLNGSSTKNRPSTSGNFLRPARRSPEASGGSFTALLSDSDGSIPMSTFSVSSPSSAS